MSYKRILRIASRRSPLALWQANTVKDLLEKQGFSVELNLVVTSGDKMQRGALAEIALDDPNLPAHLKTGKGLFVKEVQEEILAGRADLAVHSMKDLPVETTQGLRVAAVLPRANPADVMIFSPRLLSALNLQQGLDGHAADVLRSLNDYDWSGAAPIGTTSARRQCFLKETLSHAQIPLVVLRGNVDTRLARVENNEFSFIMLARAGIDRLGLYKPDRMLTLPPALSVPAPAQGVVAIECRESDDELRTTLAKLNHSLASLQAACERAALWLTGGNCHTALAAHFHGTTLTTWAAKDDRRSDLVFELSASEAELLNAMSLIQDHHEIFHWFLQNSPAQRLHAKLVEQGFAQLMDLRSVAGQLKE